MKFFLSDVTVIDLIERIHSIEISPSRVVSRRDISPCLEIEYQFSLVIRNRFDVSCETKSIHWRIIDLSLSLSHVFV